MRSTVSPARSPASRVAARWASLKNAGTVITARVTSCSRAFSATDFKWPKIAAETSTGVTPKAFKS